MSNNINVDQGDETLSRENPITDFLKSQRGNLKGMTQEEFMAKYEEHMARSAEVNPSIFKDKMTLSDARSRYRPNGGFLNKIVLKFTTLSEGCNEAPSFIVSTSGAKIGRDLDNEIYVPSDPRLAPKAHAIIEYSKGNFYFSDGGFDHAASIRIGVGSGHGKLWTLDIGSRFSAGNSVFECQGLADNGDLIIVGIDGPLKGERKMIGKAGASFGRSSDNAISIPDRELSRRHSKIDFDSRIGKYILSDIGSTNGTYMQLVGPNAGKHRLSLNDHILVGRTGFSINRFDYGVSEEKGHRPTMEDACAIVQHLNIGPLCVHGLAPQSFFGVFDGHGGNQASHYLSQHLHVNIADGLINESVGILKNLESNDPNEGWIDLNILPESHPSWKSIDDIVIKSLKSIFLRTDHEFLTTSPSPQHGSTATTTLVLGSRLYCANVGDSRVLLSRNFQAVPLTVDHKPGREDETKRIRDAGGFVINNRVMGELAVSRAFGDCDFKKGLQVSYMLF